MREREKEREREGERKGHEGFHVAAATAAAEKERRLHKLFFAYPLFILSSANNNNEQVIGNKWDTYLELLQAEYSER